MTMKIGLILAGAIVSLAAVAVYAKFKQSKNKESGIDDEMCNKETEFSDNLWDDTDISESDVTIEQQSSVASKNAISENYKKTKRVVEKILNDVLNDISDEAADKALIDGNKH